MTEVGSTNHQHQHSYPLWKFLQRVAAPPADATTHQTNHKGHLPELSSPIGLAAFPLDIQHSVIVSSDLWLRATTAPIRSTFRDLVRYCSMLRQLHESRQAEHLSLIHAHQQQHHQEGTEKAHEETIDDVPHFLPACSTTHQPSGAVPHGPRGADSPALEERTADDAQTMMPSNTLHNMCSRHLEKSEAVISAIHRVFHQLHQLTQHCVAGATSLGASAGSSVAGPAQIGAPQVPKAKQTAAGGRRSHREKSTREGAQQKEVSAPIYRLFMRQLALNFALESIRHQCIEDRLRTSAATQPPPPQPPLHQSSNGVQADPDVENQPGATAPAAGPGTGGGVIKTYLVDVIAEAEYAVLRYKHKQTPVPLHTFTQRLLEISLLATADRGSYAVPVKQNVVDFLHTVAARAVQDSCGAYGMHAFPIRAPSAYVSQVVSVVPPLSPEPGTAQADRRLQVALPAVASRSQGESARNALTVGTLSPGSTGPNDDEVLRRSEAEKRTVNARMWSRVGGNSKRSGLVIDVAMLKSNSKKGSAAGKDMESHSHPWIHDWLLDDREDMLTASYTLRSGGGDALAPRHRSLTAGTATKLEPIEEEDKNVRIALASPAARTAAATLPSALVQNVFYTNTLAASAGLPSDAFAESQHHHLSPRSVLASGKQERLQLGKKDKRRGTLSREGGPRFSHACQLRKQASASGQEKALIVATKTQEEEKGVAGAVAAAEEVFYGAHRTGYTASLLHDKTALGRRIKMAEMFPIQKTTRTPTPPPVTVEDSGPVQAAHTGSALAKKKRGKRTEDSKKSSPTNKLPKTLRY